MSKLNNDIIDSLYRYFTPQVQYSFLDFKGFLDMRWGKRKISKKSLDSMIKKEIEEKKIPKILITKDGDEEFYVINPKSYKVSDDNNDLIQLVKRISRIIHRENRSFIEDWLKNSLVEHSKNVLEDVVKEEIKKEVIPVILSKLEERVKIEVARKLKDILSESIEAL